RALRYRSRRSGPIRFLRGANRSRRAGVDTLAPVTRSRRRDGSVGMRRRRHGRRDMVERFFHLALWFNAAMLGAAFLIGRLLGVDVVATLGFTVEAVLLGVASTVPAAALLWRLD